MVANATATPALTPSPGRFWVTRAAFGILLWMVIVALEFAYYFPLVSVRGELGLDSFVSLLMTWGGECVLLALAVGFVEYRMKPRELRAWELALTVAAGAFSAALVWNVFTDYVLRDQLGLKLFVDHVGQPVPWVGRVFYHGWLLFFFGGLGAAVHASLRRRARMVAVLRAAELARATSQQRLAEVTLGSLEAKVDPDSLFSTLTRLEGLYETDPAAADRLLDEVITRLRSAVAGIRDSAAEARGAPIRIEPQPALTAVQEQAF
jgi:hypothetical protein